MPRVLNGGNRLLDLLFPLGNYGIGARVTRTTWNSPNCYWMITKVKYNKRFQREDGVHPYGKVWGSLYWRDELKGRENRRIPGHAKSRWQVLAEPKTQDRPPLTKRLHRKYYVVV